MLFYRVADLFMLQKHCFCFPEQVCNMNVPNNRNENLYTVSHYITCLSVSPDIVFYNRTYVKFPPIYRAPIYRAFLLSPEKHGRSGDDCNQYMELSTGVSAISW